MPGVAQGFPDIRQAEAAECGLACLAMIAGYHGRHIDLATLRRRHPISVRGASLRSVMSMAMEMDMAVVRCAWRVSHLCATANCRPSCTGIWTTSSCCAGRPVVASTSMIRRPDPPLFLCRSRAAFHRCGVGTDADTVVRPGFRTVAAAPEGHRDLAEEAGPSVLQALLLSVLLQVYVVASPFYMQIAMDDAVAQNDHDLLTVLAVGFGIFLLINVGRRAVAVACAGASADRPGL